MVKFGALHRGLGSSTTTTSLEWLESQFSGVVLVVAMAVNLNVLFFLELCGGSRQQVLESSIVTT